MTRTNSSQDSRTTRFNIDHADRVSFPFLPPPTHPIPRFLLQPPSRRRTLSSGLNLGFDSVILSFDVLHAVPASCNRIVNEERRGRNCGVAGRGGSFIDTDDGPVYTAECSWDRYDSATRYITVKYPPLS